MAKIEVKYCPKCKEFQECSWVCDPDSDPLEPNFLLCCLICGCEFTDPPISYGNLPKDQKQLFPVETEGLK